MHHLLSKFALILSKFLKSLSFHLVKIRLDFIVEHNLKNLKTNNKVVHTLVKDNDKSLCFHVTNGSLGTYWFRFLCGMPLWVVCLPRF
jgi:hypothetical protein